MAGLLDENLLRTLLSGGGLLSSPPAPNGPALGLLSGGFQPKADEGLLARVFGDPRNAADPRPDAMNALAVGLLRGDLASGLEGANKAFADTEDRTTKRLGNTLSAAKSIYDLAGVQQAFARNQAIARDRANLRPGQPQATGVDSFNTPTIGGMPMFSMGTNAGPVPGAGPTGTPASERDRVYRQLLATADIYERNGDAKTALEYYQRAEQFKPGKFGLTPQLMKDPRTGKLVQVVMNEDGNYQVLPFGAKPDWAIEDLGGHKGAIDKNEIPAGGQSWQKSPTFADQTAAGNLSVAQQNLGLTRDRLKLDQDRFNLEQNAPQYISTDAGIIALPKRPAPGPITGQVVTGQGGQPLGTSGFPKLTEVQGNATQFSARMLSASRIIDELESGKDRPWPSTVERAGYDPQMPNWLPGGQAIAGGMRAANQTTIPANAERYYQAQQDWVTANLRKESGAAIGELEMQREIRKWFPVSGEGAEAIRQKAEARKVAEQAMLTQAGPGREMALRIAREAAERAGKSGGNAEAQPLPDKPSAANLKAGTSYRLKNGEVGTWDGQRFVVKGQ